LAIAIMVSMATCVVTMGAHPETQKLIDTATQEVGEMEPKQLKKLLDEEKPVIVMDIREENQRAEGEIYASTTLAITRGNLEFEVLNKIKDKKAVIVTYCRGGSRGVLAAQTLKKLGFVNAINLKGGLKGWAENGFPIETGMGVTHLSKEQ